MTRLERALVAAGGVFVAAVPCVALVREDLVAAVLGCAVACLYVVAATWPTARA